MDYKYARVKQKVLSVKRGKKPLLMQGRIFPIVDEDIETGFITLLAEGREIPIDPRYVEILYAKNSETQREGLM